MSDENEYVRERRAAFLLNRQFKRGDGTLTGEELRQWAEEVSGQRVAPLVPPFGGDVWHHGQRAAERWAINIKRVPRPCVRCGQPYGAGGGHGPGFCIDRRPKDDSVDLQTPGATPTTVSNRADRTPDACEWCSTSTNLIMHNGLCPLVSAIDYYPTGGYKRVEFRGPVSK